MNKIIIFVAFLSFSAFSQDISKIRKTAFEKLDYCDQSIFSNDHYLAVSMPNESTGISQVHIDSLINEDSFDVLASDKIVDIKIADETLWVLTQTTLESWNLKNRTQLFIVKSHPDIKKSSSWRQKANGFVIYEDKIVIAHSVLGFSVLDLVSGKILKTIPMPTVSSAQDIAILNQSSAVVAVDNNDDAAFRGIYILDLKSMSITKQIKIDNAFPSSIRVLDNNRLMIEFFNAIWKFDLSKVISSKNEPNPTRRAWKFPGINSTDIVGKVFFDEKNLYGCFNVSDEKTGVNQIKPFVFNLASLKLD